MSGKQIMSESKKKRKLSDNMRESPAKRRLVKEEKRKRGTIEERSSQV